MAILGPTGIRLVGQAVAVVIFLLVAAGLGVSAQDASTSAASISVSTEITIATDLFLPNDFTSAGTGLSTGLWEKMVLSFSGDAGDGLSLRGSLYAMLFQNRYATLFASSLGLTPAEPFLLGAQWLYGRVSAGWITLDVGLKTDIDLENVIVDLFAPYGRLLIASQFGASSRFQFHLRIFPADFLKLTLKWYPSTSFQRDLFAISAELNFGDIRLSFPAVYDTAFHWTRTGGELAFFFLTEWHAAYVAHFDPAGYEGYEFKIGLRQEIGDISFEAYYYRDGIPFDAAEFDNAIAHNSYALLNLNRIFLSQSDFALLTAGWSPDPFWNISLRGIAVFDPFDMLVMADVTVKLGSGLTLGISGFFSAGTGDADDIASYASLLFGQGTTALLSVRMTYTF